VRALLDEVDPDRRAVQRFAVHSATLDDVFLALTGHPAGPADRASLTDQLGESDECAIVPLITGAMAHSPGAAEPARAQPS
jgi:hypothetical protein